MAGEQPADENADDPRGFLAKPRWQRLIIAFAGPFMNMVLAVGAADRPVHGEVSEGGRRGHAGA